MSISLRPYQQEAVEAVWKHLREREDNPCIVLPTGCHAKGHPILMYDGTVKKVEDIQVNDLIMGNDSTPRQVLQLARGREQMVRIIPIKGEAFIVNRSHILSLVSTSEGKKAVYPSCQRGGEITNISVNDYIQKSKSWKHLRKLYHVSIDFSNAYNLIIPPYILGLIIGDGSILNCVSLTTADPELADIFINYAEKMDCHISVSHNGSKAYTYHIVNQKGKVNPVINALRKLGLFNHNAFSKFIPREYLTASREDRLLLLAGLLDSDGYCKQEEVEYMTASKQLANDICFLARSLGYCVTMHNKYCKCQTGKGGWYYRLNISGDFVNIPYQRFKHLPSTRLQKKNVLRTGFSVELLDEDDFYGFALDGNHLYVDGNFVVHHNTGKSLVLGKIASDAVTLWGGRVLILAHVKELLEQNAEKVRMLCPNLKVGIYSAGLKSRDKKEQVIVAGIQSVHKRADELGAFDIIITDEAHMIPAEGEGMYREFLADAKVINPNVRLIGLTATPFRLKGGLICKPENLLNHICYEAGLKEMIVQGYLSPIVPKAGDNNSADFSSLHIRAGEFVSDEVEVLMNNDRLVQIACKEIVNLTKDRKTVLIFGVSVNHCKKIKKCIEEQSGEECAIVTGDTPANERQQLLDRIKGKEVQADLFGNKYPPLKYLVNVSVLTTGFDAPNIDCIAILRPTASAGLLLQMVGRGLRLSPETGKRDCLILDFGENIMRHGPLDAIRVEEKERKGRKDGEKPAKKCPQCNALIETARTICQFCGYVFPPRELKHVETASSDGVLTGQISDIEYTVTSVSYQKWIKRKASEGTPPTVMAEYSIGFNKYQREWLCPEHTGYARQKFEKWWEEHNCAEYAEPPATVDEFLLLANSGQVKFPQKITVRHIAGEQFDRVIGYVYGEQQFPYAPIEQDDEYQPPELEYSDFGDEEVPF